MFRSQTIRVERGSKVSNNLLSMKILKQYPLHNIKCTNSRMSYCLIYYALKGFGLSLIYKGLDKYSQDEVGVYVAKIVPGGQSQRAGLRENDRILQINGKVKINYLLPD